ncbi:Xanthomonas XOO_2897-like deaminase [Streptomyces sp. TLI_053]|uniref:SUKH-4 family immunity protein n=1 Tax=Streptomyces sp. TLI_053 TaxID=1855352 RepID=UPI00087D5164|nr:SUKH-4 family immunity protein [Streptomyces sp. TLI_053]SDT65728.1 Xanthomonas XOO_2897-like deaminase [Streptomyces sp. TLI_053]
MVTYAQAQELAEEWINGGVSRERQREVRVREFDLGFVCWAVQSAEGGTGAEGEARLVIARDSGASTLWPALPVNEVVRQYEETYGRPVAANPAGAARPAPGPVEATSFLLSPPQWLQEAGEAALAAEAERLGAPAAAGTPASGVPVAGAEPAAPAGPAVLPPPPPAPPLDPAPAVPPTPGVRFGRADTPGPAVLTTPPVSERPAGDAPTMLAPPPGHDEPAGPPAHGPGVEAATVLLPDGLRTNGAGLSGEPRAGSEAATVLLPEGARPGLAGLPGAPGGPGTPVPGTPVPPSLPPMVEPAPTLLAPPDGLPGLAGLPGAPGGPGTPAPGTPVPPPAGPGVEHAATMLASPDGLPGLAGLPGAPGAPVPPPVGPSAEPAPPGALGRAPGSAPPPPPPAALRGGAAGPGAGPAPAALGRNPGSAPPPPPPAELRGGSGPAVSAGSGGRGASSAPPPPPPAGLRPADAPGAPPAAPAASGGVAYERTQLAGAIDPGTPPSGGPAVPPPPGAGAPAAGYGYPAGPAPAAPAPAPVAAPVPPAPVPPVPGPPPGAPVPPGVPAVGPGYFAALSYRGPDGSEQKLLHRSEPGTPHPEWKILQDLRRLNVPPEQVLELYTELESCDLPGGYCHRMIAASWPNVRLTHTADYGREHHSRQAGMAQLLDHLDELHQLASGPQRVRPLRVPLPAPGTVPAPQPVPPQQLGQELGQAFGANVFRFEQRAVARQGVPEPVAQTLMWAGLPREFGPFFWAQAQEGRPIPTLAELAAERGLAGGTDFGGYLVLGNDYGRQLCVQYGTAHVVAMDLEGTGEPPRFVNTGVPEFVRALALLGRMWRLRYGLTPDQAGRWTTDFQAQLAAIDPAALQSADTWWAVLLEQFWDGLL